MFYVLDNNVDFLTDQIGSIEVEYIPGMIYCFLPSMEKRQGSVTVSIDLIRISISSISKNDALLNQFTIGQVLIGQKKAFRMTEI